MKPRDKDKWGEQDRRTTDRRRENGTLEGRIEEKHEVHVCTYTTPTCNPAGQHSGSAVASTGRIDMGTHRTPL